MTRTILYFSLFLFGLSLVQGAAPGARSGTVSSDVFLGGNYIELGINTAGTFGTVSSKPSDLIGTTVRNQIGMSTDLDGFGVGTTQSFDYFTPGTPFVGWFAGYKIGGTATTGGNSTTGSGGNVSGVTEDIATTVSNTSSGSTISATASGTLGGKLQVDQAIVLGVNDRFFKITVTLNNVSAGSLDNVRYMWAVDPDNVRDLGGSFNTVNTILNTIAAGDGKAVVEANTLSSESVQARLILYTTDNRARASRGLSSISGASIYSTGSIYDSAPSKGSTQSEDARISMTWDVGTLTAGQSTSFVLYISLSNQSFSEIESSIQTSDPRPSVSSLSSSVNFAENTLNAGAQIIDSDVTVTDADSSNFNGGNLTLTYSSGGATEDSPFTVSYSALAAAANEADAESDSISFRIESVSSGTLTKNGATVTVGTTRSSSDESLVWTPASNVNGTLNAFTIVAWDGQEASSSAVQVQVEVVSVNDRPTLDAISNPAAILEDASQQTVSLAGIGSGASNESQTLVITATSDNAGLIPNPTVSYTSPNSTGSLSYAPVAHANGTATITVTVTDNGGTTSGGVNSITRSFLVNVTAVNDSPSFTRGADLTVLEDSAAQTVPNWATGMSAGPSDESSQTLTFLVSNNNSALFSTAPNLSASGTVSYSLAANANGNATVTVRLQDNGGVSNGGVDVSPEQTFTITVTPVNDPPTLAAIDDLVIQEDPINSYGVTLLNITPGPSNEPQLVTVQVSSSNPAVIPQPELNYVQPNTQGSLSLRPAPNAHGTARITVYVRDNGGTSNGGTDDITRSFTVTVNPVNDPPTLTRIDLLPGGSEDTPFVITYEALAASSDIADIDGPSLLFRLESLQQGTLVKDGSGGDLNLLRPGDRWTWTPPPNSNQVLEAFQVRAFDSEATSANPVSVRISISPVNDSPFLSPFTDRTLSEDTPHLAEFTISDIETAATDLIVVARSSDPDGFGVASAIDRDTIVIGAFVADGDGKTDSGAAYIFGRQSDQWIQRTKLMASRGAEFDRFGSSVSISGDTIAVGANRAALTGESESGSSYVYVRSGTNWVEQARLTTSDGLTSDWLGTSVAVLNDTLVIGAFRADMPLSPDAGAVYLFQRKEGAWTEQAKFLASDPSANDRLGAAVALSEVAVLGGAPGADITEQRDAGAVYVFSRGDRVEEPLPLAPHSSGENVTVLISFGTDNSGAGVQTSEPGLVRIRPIKPARDHPARLEVIGLSGTTVQLEVATDLRQWQALQTLILSDERLDFEDAFPANSGPRFYRAIVVQPPSESEGQTKGR